MDFHCHLDLYPKATQVYAEALERTEFLWLVTTSPRAFEATSKVLPATHKLVISPGLHPEVVDKKAGELDMLLSQLEHCKGVGEIGLDGSRQYGQHFGLQKHVFQSVVQRCATLGGRILNIHSRRAAGTVLDILSANPGFGVAVLHWFTDSAPLLHRAMELGCWFSIGPAMLESSNGKRLAALMPPNRVVPESDGPLAKAGGIPVMPWQANSIATKLAGLWNLPQETTFETLRSNGFRLAGFLASGGAGN